MANGPWTNEENGLIVADYFAMLGEYFAGRPNSKAGHRRALVHRVKNRSEVSIQFKHRNISAVLNGFGDNWSPRCRLALTLQEALEGAAAQWLARFPDWLECLPIGCRAGAAAMWRAVPSWLEPPPALSNQPSPQELDQMVRIARKFNVAGWGQRNRALGGPPQFERPRSFFQESL